MNLPRVIAIKSITYYQSELSHKKKYHCAHRALHQGLTCSEYSKQQIENAGFLIGLKKTFSRLKECYMASKKIKKMSSDPTHSNKSNQKQEEKNDTIDTCTKLQLAADTACCLFTFWPT